MTTSVADVNQRLSTGAVSPGFEAVRNQLDAYLLAGPAHSAQLSVYWNGELIVDLTGGPDLASDSVTGVFSVSKGISTLVIATWCAMASWAWTSRWRATGPSSPPRGRVRARRGGRRAGLRRPGVRDRLRLHPDADPVPGGRRPEGGGAVHPGALVHPAA